jgi:hypothetical protein
MAIVWLHGDSLSPTDAALTANPGAPAIFVFDEPFLRRAQLSFGRLLFLYESACEALAGRPHAIVRGSVTDEIRAFAAAHGTAAVHVTTSIAPRFADHCTALRTAGLQLTLHHTPPFVHWHGPAPSSFSAFWRQVKDEV